jgi:hypothetical protein
VATTNNLVAPADRSTSMCSVHDEPVAPASTIERPANTRRIGSIHQSSMLGP